MLLCYVILVTRGLVTMVFPRGKPQWYPWYFPVVPPCSTHLTKEPLA